MQIIIESKVKHELLNLVIILIKDGYFATESAAAAYVKNIYAYIDTIPNRTPRTTKNGRYGQYFVTYKPNRRTTWFIAFDISEDRYLIRNVLNNHSKDYPDFMSSRPAN